MCCAVPGCCAWPLNLTNTDTNTAKYNILNATPPVLGYCPYADAPVPQIGMLSHGDHPSGGSTTNTTRRRRRSCRGGVVSPPTKLCQINVSPASCTSLRLWDHTSPRRCLEQIAQSVVDGKTRMGVGEGERCAESAENIFFCGRRARAAAYHSLLTIHPHTTLQFTGSCHAMPLRCGRGRDPAVLIVAMWATRD
jgi:hypothetical protein